MTASTASDLAGPDMALCRSVLEAISEGVILIREDGFLMAANESAGKLLGLGATELPCAGFFERWQFCRADGVLFSPAEHPVRLAFQAGASRQSMVLGIRRPDSTCRWLSCGIYPVPPAGAGEPRLMIAAFEMLALQRESEIEMRAVTDFLPVGVHLQDVAGNCLYVNRRWEELTGMTFADAKNQGWKRLIHPDDLDPANEAWETAVRENRLFHAELRIIRPDDRMLWVSVRAGRVEMADGALYGFSGTLVDITSRKQAELALAASEQRFRLLVDNSHDIVAELSGAGEILHTSANLQAHLGLTEGEPWSAALLLARVHPDDRLLVISALRQPHGMATFRFSRNPGEWDWFDAWSRRYTTPDGEARRVIFGRNVTERKIAEAAQAQLEAQLRQSQKMEAIGTLAGGVAHDFNNILAGIFGHVELLRMDLPPDSPLREPAQQILRGALRARDLVRQILTFSRNKEARREPMRLSAAVEEALKLLRASLPSSIEFSTAWPDDEPLIQADSGQIHQIIMNVGLNAAHAIGSRSGCLKATVTVVDLDEAFTDGHPPLLPGRHVRLTLADDGCGMDADLRQRVFEPFFTTKPPGQGTGLGLAVVHGIVQMHQGAVTVTSEPGAGASFAFFFRALEASAPGSGSDEMRPPIGSGQRIMVVDDEEPVMWAARNFLTRLGYEATGFLSSLEALEVFSQAPQDFDAVLTDLTMPQLNGLELARRMLAIRPELPVILMSGYLHELDDPELQAVGVVRVVLKPFSVQGLAEAIAEVFRPPGA